MAGAPREDQEAELGAIDKLDPMIPAQPVQSANPTV